MDFTKGDLAKSKHITTVVFYVMWPFISTQNILVVTYIPCLALFILGNMLYFLMGNLIITQTCPKNNLGRCSIYLFFIFKHFKF